MKSEYCQEFSRYFELSGLTPVEVANSMEIAPKTVKRWCAGEAEPKKADIAAMKTLALATAATAPFKRDPKKHNKFKFIDLFAGIGGIRIPFQELGGHCVFTSEWDKFSQQTYKANFVEKPHGDITKIAASDIPAHDILLAGFPCQAFSQAGLKQGFLDTRGTMFFEIQRILSHHRPKAFMLENVKQLKGHDKGRTLRTILDILRGEHNSEIPENIPMSKESLRSLGDRLNYWVDYRVLRAADFGVPQNRERIFIVGINKDHYPDVDFDSVFKWPTPPMTKTRLGDILSKNKSVEDKYTISDTLWSGHQRRKIEHRDKGNGFGYSLFNRESPYASTISARYYKDGSEILIDQSDIGKNPRKLTPRECAALQGFPKEFVIDKVSDVQAYKQFGNSVAVPVIQAVANSILEAINNPQEARKAA